MARILIVEDEKNISDLIKDTISLAHYEYDCSYDGEDALNKIKETKYDLILLDIMLPKLDGFEIIEKINRAFHEGRNYYTSDPILIDLVGILHARMFLYFSKELQAINKKLDKIIKQTKSIN